MSFKVGDIIRGKRDNDYSITNEKSLLLVTRTWDDCMNVTVLYHTQGNSYVGESHDVQNSVRRFCSITPSEFLEEYPNCHKINRRRIREILDDYSIDIDIDEVFPTELIVNPPTSGTYVLSDEKKNELLEEMKTLLKKYHYNFTDDGLNRILNEWCKNKSDLIQLFEKHPNYNGKFQIVFDYDFDRVIDMGAVRNFEDWLNSEEVQNVFKKEIQIGAYSYSELNDICNRLYTVLDIFNYHSEVHTINGKNKEDYLNEYKHFCSLRDAYEDSTEVFIECGVAYDKKLMRNRETVSNVITVLCSTSNVGQFINSAIEDYLLRHHPEAKIKAGQKYSRAINKLLSSVGVDKLPNYNKEYAKFSDGINPLKVKRHTVISVHPIDYYTMSFGNSWSSCQTIDKCNDRGIDSGNSWHGCSSSGTESYMLDGTSCIFYTIDGEYNGDTLELEDKINRCMFHYYDSQLIQGRVYPQSNDKGANDLYKDIREIAQKVFADMLEVPNYWSNDKGTQACYNVSESWGTHYRDYYNFDNCNVSTLKDDKTSHKTIKIGHYPICPDCGEEHDREDNIVCRYCS